MLQGVLSAAFWVTSSSRCDVMSCCMTESISGGEYGGRQSSVVEWAVTGVGERGGGDDSRPEPEVAVVVDGGVGGFALAAGDGVSTGSESSSASCSRSLAVHDSTPELDSTVHLVASSDFASGSSTSLSSSKRHCFPSSSICLINNTNTANPRWPKLKAKVIFKDICKSQEVLMQTSWLILIKYVSIFIFKGKLIIDPLL